MGERLTVARSWVFPAGCWFCEELPLDWEPSRPSWGKAADIATEEGKRAAGFVRGVSDKDRQLLVSVDCNACHARAIGWIAVTLGARGAVHRSAIVPLTQASVGRAGWISDSIAWDLARLTGEWPHARDAESAVRAILPLLPEDADE